MALERGERLSLAEQASELREEQLALARSQAGFAQNFLSVAAPPSLVCCYMNNTGLSLYEDGYRLGGLTRYGRFQTAMTAACREPSDNAKLIAEWAEHPDKDE